MPRPAGLRARISLFAPVFFLLGAPVEAGDLIYSNGFETGLCVWSSVTNPEVCDDVDNDCDKVVDEGGVCLVCGDGFIAPGEGCDDGDVDGGDGCNNACQVESGFECAGEPSVCTPTCGDGLVVGGEGCDDGPPAEDGDGCSAACQVELGWECTGKPSICVTTCGDGIPAGIEECDDAPPAECCDGCSASCVVEPGWQCTGIPSVCVPN